MSYLAQPKDPFRDVLKAMTGKEPPAFVKGYGSRDLTDQQQMELQDWCSSNAEPFWLTGIGLWEAAEQQVKEAVSNGNIPRDPEEPPKPKRVQRNYFRSQK